MSRTLKSIFADPFIWIMIALFALCNVCVIWIFVTIYWQLDMTDLHGQLFAVRLMQVTLGMVIGLSTTFLGMIAAWFGLSGDVDVEVDGGNVRARLLSAGPGAILVLCGTFLVYTCITKQFVHETTEPLPDVSGVPISKAN